MTIVAPEIAARILSFTKKRQHVFSNFMNSKCEIPSFVCFVDNCACLLASQQMYIATTRHRNRDQKQKDSFANCIENLVPVTGRVQTLLSHVAM